MKQIKSLIILIWLFLVKEFQFVINRIRFYIAKREADRLHAITRKQYHVILVDKKYRVVDNKVVNIYNKNVKDKSARKIGVVDVIRMAKYSTKTSTQ